MVDAYNQARTLLERAQASLESLEASADGVKAELQEHMKGQAELFSALEERNRESWREYQAALRKAVEDARAAQAMLRDEVGERLGALRGELEQRLQQRAERAEAAEERVTSLAGEFEEFRDKVRSRLRHAEERYRRNEAALAKARHGIAANRWLGILALLVAAGALGLLLFGAANPLPWTPSP